MSCEQFFASGLRPKIRTVSLALVVLLLFVVPGLARVPYSNTVFDYWGNPEPAPQAYVPKLEIGGLELGIGALREPRSVYAGADGYVYIADTGNNRIIKLDSNYRLVDVFTEFSNNGVADSFAGPVGVFVYQDGNIYVADTENSRIVELTGDGQFVRTIGSPQTDVRGVLPDEFLFHPTKVVVDRAGRVFVLARDVFDGIMEFDNAGQFRGFVGAPRITPSAADIFWSRIATQEQRLRRQLFLPIEYASIDIDQFGFIFGVETGPAKNNSIKRLNPAGQDILRRLGFHAPVGQVSWWLGRSIFVDVAPREAGMYSVLDHRHGVVYTYDGDGHLLYSFGSRGSQMGAFSNPASLTANGEEMLVLDRRTGLLTVFRPTEYAQMIHTAISEYDAGRYEPSAQAWKAVLERNANSALAYYGVGMAHFRNQEYVEAMEMFRLAYNRRRYSDAFTYYRRDVIGENFGMVALGLLGLIVLLYLSARFGWFAGLQKRWIVGEVSDVSEKGKLLKALGYAMYVIFHPFDGFWDLKHERRGNLVSASILLLLVTMTYVFIRQYTGFIFNHSDPSRLNVYLELSSVLLPFFLWCSVNWALTTLMDGKGTFSDIFIATAYALTPIVLLNLPAIPLSHVLTLDEGTFYSLIMSTSVVWSMLLLFFGTMTVHDYSGMKMVWTSILTVAGMAFCIFVGMLFFSLLNRVATFALEVYNELVFRL